MVLITIVTGVYKPTYNWGAPPCRDRQTQICVYIQGITIPIDSYFSDGVKPPIRKCGELGTETSLWQTQPHNYGLNHNLQQVNQLVQWAISNSYVSHYQRVLFSGNEWCGIFAMLQAKDLRTGHSSRFATYWLVVWNMFSISVYAYLYWEQ